MTLNDLYKEFEAARDEYAKHYRAYLNGNDFDEITRFIKEERLKRHVVMSPEDAAKEILSTVPLKPNSLSYKFQRRTILARRYIIARDFNEYDPQKTDMLWKLAN